MRRLRYLGEFVINLKFQGKILYVTAHPEEEIGEAMLRKEEKKKQNAAEKARIQKEKDKKLLTKYRRKQKGKN